MHIYICVCVRVRACVCVCMRARLSRKNHQPIQELKDKNNEMRSNIYFNKQRILTKVIPAYARIKVTLRHQHLP
jgi:hypothetical protein